MSQDNTRTASINPTFATNDTSVLPDEAELNFKAFQHTGYKIVIDVPEAKNDRQPLAAISMSGFIPFSNATDTNDAWNLMQVNESLVQNFHNSLSTVKILQEQCEPTAKFLYSSHRYSVGSPNYLFRMSTNTSISGNLFFTQASGVIKRPLIKSDKYKGLLVSNMPMNNTDWDKDSLVLADVSLIRTVKIVPLQRIHQRAYDWQLIQNETIFPDTSQTLNFRKTKASYMMRDFLVLGTLSGFHSAAEAGQITIDVFADWSKVMFIEPLLPLIPTPPNDKGKQILEFTETFRDQVIDATKKGVSIWLPGII